MAQFDLKNALIFFRDGYANSGVINHASGYSAGTLVIVLDGFTGAVANGDKFVIAGDSKIYTIIGHAETLGNTTSVTIAAPGLLQDVLDNAVITFSEANASPAQINHAGTYAIGVTALIIDTFVGAVAVGDFFTIAGDPTIYTVLTHTETLSNTTSLTISSPGLVAAAADNAVITFFQANVDTAAVNQPTGGYTAGATNITVSGVVGILEDFDIFYLAGDTTNTKYVITAHTETLGNTTNITFAPAIPATVTIANGATVTIGPHELEIKLGTGTLTFTEKKMRQYTLDRGLLDTVRNGDETPMEVKLDATWEFLRSESGQPPTPEDVVKQRGNASTWVTSSADPCEPFSVDVVIVYNPNCTGEETEIITMPDFRYEEIVHDTKAGTLAFTGKCNVTEAVTQRVAA